jgi:hypothetical protein
VVSFRANVNGSTVNQWDGLIGKYPSQLFLLTMQSVRTEYTIAEMRELRAYPLLLNDAQKQAFLERVAEMFWEYRGRYFFATNNCATETLRLIRGALNDPRLDEQSALTPKGLHELLLKTGWIDNSALFNRAQAIQLGLLFPSIYSNLKQSFTWMTGLTYGKWAQDPRYLEPMFRQFLALSTANSRLDAFRKSLAIVPANQRAVLAAHYFLTEAYFESRLQVALQRRAAKLLFEDPAKFGIDTETASALKRSLAEKQALDPVAQVQEGYGIPLASETATTDVVAISEDTKKLMESLKGLLRNKFASDFSELDSIAGNLSEYSKALR